MMDFWASKMTPQASISSIYPTLAPLALAAPLKSLAAPLNWAVSCSRATTKLVIMFLALKLNSDALRELEKKTQLNSNWVDLTNSVIPSLAELNLIMN